MNTLHELLRRMPLTPYIRNADYAVRRPWHYPPSRLLDYLLVYFQEGHCRFITDGAVHDFHAGDFCLIQPSSMNSMQGLTNTITPFVHMDLFYNPYRESGFSTRPGLSDISSFKLFLQPRLNDLAGIQIPVKLRFRQPSQCRDLLLDMIRRFKQADPISQLWAQTLASQLILIILEDHMDAFDAVQPDTPLPALHWIPAFMSFHLSEPLSVEALAARAQLSPSRFTALFKMKFGVSPYQYLLELRLQHAKNLLRTTSLNITEIADYCGFRDIHHFSKIFKQKCGVSPMRFRDSHG